MRALVIADEPGWRLGLEKRLRLELFETFGVGSGREGLRALRRLKPDLVVLDLAPPGLSGSDVLRIKARDPSIAAIPVLVVTGSDDLEALAAAHSHGAGACLGRPFPPARLAALARHLVSRR